MGRNVLVTGSSHGIGAAVAIAFAKQGDNVGITYLKSPEGAKTVQEECLKYGVDAQIFQVDLSVRSQCEKLMEEFLAHYKDSNYFAIGYGQGIDWEYNLKNNVLTPFLTVSSTVIDKEEDYENI